MLTMGLIEKSFNKTRLNIGTGCKSSVNEHSNASIEFTYSNISAAMIKLGCP